jgi:nucleoside-diphosphate-sugar epimerase
VSKFLITGGAGFLGERISSAMLAEGNEVHIVDNFSRGQNDQAFKTLAATRSARILKEDLLAPNALGSLASDYDFIVHLAAIVGVQNVLERPYDTLQNNVLMHQAAIRFALRQKLLKRFVFASTSEVYAGSLRRGDLPIPTPEDITLTLTPLHEPRSSYMLSKIYGEAMLFHSGLPFTIVRPHNIYGPRMGMAHVVPQLLEKAHRARLHSFIDVFSVDHRRSFCFIDDAVEMIKRVLDSPAALNQVFNLGAEGPEVTVRRVAEIVISTVGKPLVIRSMPPTPGSPVRRAPQMTRMTKATGYVAQIGLEAGIGRTYDWYRDHIFASRVMKR